MREHGFRFRDRLVCLLPLLLAAACASAANTAKDDAAVLGEARDVLKRSVSDERRHISMRRDAARALNRVHEALNDWGRKGELEWYLEQLRATSDDYIQGYLLDGAQSASNAGTHHLGVARELWATVDGLVKAGKLSLHSRGTRVRREFDETLKHITRVAAVTPTDKPMSITPPKLDIRSSLKPFPEPKK